MTNDPKRPSAVPTAPGSSPLAPGALRPPVPVAPALGHSVRPPPSVSPASRPSNIRDALTEAHAVAGGAFGKVSAPAPKVAQGRKTVMLVDDDPTARARLRAVLEATYDIIECKDGMEAVEMTAKIQPPAMIVSDVVMPRVDGYTLAKILRGNPIMKRVPIMFVSSRHSPQDVTQALVLGACHYFPKSTPVSEIAAKIKKIVP
jgi:CheY-like chemotaxis protein